MFKSKQKLNLHLESNQEEIFKLLPEAIIVFDNKGFMVEANQSLFDWLGYKKEDLIGKHLKRLPFIPSKSLALIAKQFAKRIKGEKIAPYEATFTDIKKNPRFGIIRATPIKDENGEVIADLVLVTDITKEKEAQMAMFESEEKFKLLFDDARDIIVVIDKEKRFSNVNKKFLDACGLPHIKIGDKIDKCSLFTPRSKKEAVDIIDKVLGNKPWNNIIEVEGYNKNKEKQYYEFYAIPSKKDEKVVGVIIILKNITEKKANEKRLEESESRYRLIAENTNDFIAVTTLSIPTYFTYLSSSYATIYGYGPDELVNTPALDIVHPDDHNLIIGLLKKNIEYQLKSFFSKKEIKVEFFQYRAKSKDGKWHYVESMANIVGNKVILITRDICDRVLTEKMKTEFVSIASHQLRTPLTGIGWCGDLLNSEKYGPLNQKQKDLTGKIIQSHNRMLALVNDLLAVAKIEKSTNLKIVKNKIKIVDIIDEVLDDCFALLEKKQIKIKNKIPADLSIKANYSNIKNIFNNLITNAIKYSKQGKEVMLDYKTDAESHIFIIKDQGYGIPKDEQERIFSKLFRASNAMLIDGEGTGLGLYIAKAFVSIHKGKIWFKSEENKGSTFYFSIPK